MLVTVGGLANLFDQESLQAFHEQTATNLYSMDMLAYFHDAYAYVIANQHFESPKVIRLHVRNKKH